MKKISYVAGLCAALLGMGGAVKADVVYTTSTTSGAASNTNNLKNSGLNLVNADGFRIGEFGAGTAFTRNADTAVVRFTVGGSNAVLQGIGINLFIDENGGASSAGSLLTGSLTWSLYEGTSLTQVGSNVTQSISNIAHSGTGTGDNAYQATSFSSAFNLTSGNQYTLVLQSVTVSTISGSLNNDDLHWTYTAGSGAAGGDYSVQGAGFTTGAYSGGVQTINTTGGAIAFDLVAVPEPGTMALGALASLAGVGGWWSRRKKKVIAEEVIA